MSHKRKLSARPLEPTRYQGDFAYKYRSAEHLEWLEQILLENKLYFPTAKELNDPAEARPQLAPAPLERQIEMLCRLNADPHLSNTALAALKECIASKVSTIGAHESMDMIKESLHHQLNTFRIYSLSKRPDNFHLWENYAGNHTGYCLEFRNKETLDPIWEVRYSEVMIDITDPKQVQPYFLFYKTPKWQQEEEVRMINLRNTDSTLTFDPQCLTRLILGTNISPANEAQIHKYAALREFPLPIISEQNL
jgi:hypothetical protein